MKDCDSLLAFVGSIHYEMIKSNWDELLNQKEDNYISYNMGNISAIPKRILEETDEELIEKQALLDVI